MPDSIISPRECRLDWLTLTSSDPVKRNQFLDFGAQILNTADQGSTEVRPWRWKGYAGLHKGKITFGRRDDSDIVQLTQDFAWVYFNEFWSLTQNCTRLDLCVTVDLEGELGDYIKQHHDEINAYREANRPALGVQLIYGNGKPQTCNVGSRTSDLFGRIYDKWAESHDETYRHSIRYEVEVKGAAAERCFTTLATATDRPSWIRDVVFQYFLKRGTRPYFGGVDPSVSLNTVRPVTTDATRLKWLAESVRPTVQRLLSVEKPETILAALGFPRSISELVRLRKLAERGNHADPMNQWEDDNAGDSDPR